MKIKICLSVIVFTGILTAGAQPARLLTPKDSVSYAMAMDIGQLLNNYAEDLEPEAFQDGIRDVIAGQTVMDSQEASEYLRYYFMVYKPAVNRKAADEFLASVAKQRKVKKTESGLLYKVLKKGNNVFPTDDRDIVKVHYRGYLQDGTEFDSSYDRGEPAEFGLNRVIKGWTEGMKYISEGGTIRLWIPSDLGYGDNGQPAGGIGPGVVMIFDVELLEVVPYYEPEEEEYHEYDYGYDGDDGDEDYDYYYEDQEEDEEEDYG